MRASECFEGQVVRLETPMNPAMANMVGNKYIVKGLTDRGEVRVAPEGLDDWVTVISPAHLEPD